jgi:succinate dehydrogenase/fumarate reductase flavoprotein subunit
MVFGFRCVEAIETGRTGPEPTGAMRSLAGGSASAPDQIGGRFIDVAPLPRSSDGDLDSSAARASLQQLLTHDAGVLRDAASLDRAATVIRTLAGSLATVELADPAGWEIRNLLDVGAALVAAATARVESRGCHTRRDAPDPSDEFLLRFVVGSQEPLAE